jgi:NADH-quinone oxidoreductase subunit N
MALLALAGLPPAVVGLVAKVVVLRPVAGEGTWWLAVVAALNVALGIAVYLRWIATLVQRPEHVRGEGTQAGTDPRGRTAYRLSWPHRVVISVLASLLVLGSIAPVGIW